MTVLAAYVDHEGFTAIGCDTLCTGLVRFEVGPKIVRVGRMLVGACGTSLWRSGFLPTAKAETPEDLADEWVSYARGRGHDVVDGHGGELLVAMVGRVLMIAPDGGLVEATDRYLAGGCGAEVATGVLWYMRSQHALAVDAVKHAVSAAIAHGRDCGGSPVVWRCTDDAPLGAR